MCQMRKSEEPLVVHCSHMVTNRRLRLFGHIARSSPREDHHRALAACIRQVAYRPTGSDQQEDLATLGSVQLPGERPLLETWTQRSTL